MNRHPAAGGDAAACGVARLAVSLAKHTHMYSAAARGLVDGPRDQLRRVAGALAVAEVPDQLAYMLLYNIMLQHIHG